MTGVNTRPRKYVIRKCRYSCSLSAVGVHYHIIIILVSQVQYYAIIIIYTIIVYYKLQYSVIYALIIGELRHTNGFHWKQHMLTKNKQHNSSLKKKCVLYNITLLHWIVDDELSIKKIVKPALINGLLNVDKYEILIGVYELYETHAPIRRSTHSIFRQSPIVKKFQEK